MIRKFEEKDKEQVMEIWLISNLQCHDFIPARYWRSNFTEVSRVMNLATVYVFEEQEKIAGFIGVMEDFVLGLFVKENSRGKGIGTALLNYMKSRHGSLSLAAYEKNSRAVRFYMKQGFKVQSERVDESTGERELLLAWTAAER